MDGQVHRDHEHLDSRGVSPIQRVLDVFHVPHGVKLEPGLLRRHVGDLFDRVARGGREQNEYVERCGDLGLA